MSHRLFIVRYFTVRSSWSSDYCNKRLSRFQIYLEVAHRGLDWVGGGGGRNSNNSFSGALDHLPHLRPKYPYIINIYNIFVHLKLANLSKQKHWVFHSCTPLHGSSQIKIFKNGTQSTTDNLWQLKACVRPKRTIFLSLIWWVGGLDFPLNLSKILENIREIGPHVGTYICLTYIR